MNQQIQSELSTLLDDWKAGHEVPGLQIGHGHQLDQQRMHECAFRIIDACLQTGAYDDFEGFHRFAVDIANTQKLPAAEQGAAISLAWVALRRGWTRALVGFGDARATKLRRQAEA